LHNIALQFVIFNYFKKIEILSWQRIIHDKNSI
jgi:hypothetical protein